MTNDLAQPSIPRRPCAPLKFAGRWRPGRRVQRSAAMTPAMKRIGFWSLACLGLWFGGIGQAAAEDWPQFRGATGQGISESKDVPLDWSATKNVAWKAEIPGRGWSSPVLM